MHNKAGHAVVAKGDTAYVALPGSKPQKKKIPAAILHPAAQAKDSADEGGGSYWWWLLGIALVAIAL